MAARCALYLASISSRNVFSYRSKQTATAAGLRSATYFRHMFRKP